jgi:MFS family permease
VFVALPSIKADLGFSKQGLQWVVSAYALTYGGLLLLGGRAADLLGRRRVFIVTGTVASLAGVAEEDAGLASGLNNTALQLGAALGVAIVSTVAISRSDAFLAANEGANPLAALTEGFQSAFVACVVLAGIGLAVALALLGKARNAAHVRPEPAPEPAPATAADR